MKRKLVTRVSLAILAIVPIILYAYEYAPDPGYTAAPGDNATACIASGCHTGTVNSGNGWVRIVASGGTTYVPGQTQTIQVTVNDPTERKYGFQLTARVDSNPKTTAAGLLTPGTDGYTLVLCADGSPAPAGGCTSKNGGTLEWIEHTLAGYSKSNSTPGGYTYTFSWTPPATNVGTVTLYAAGNAVSGALVVTGTNTYTTALRLSPANGATPSSITLASSPNPSQFGQRVTLTATVLPASATGLVTFYDGTRVLGTTGTTGGQAVLSTGLLSSGARSLKAYYSGDATYAASTSTALAQTVTAMPATAFLSPVNYTAGTQPVSVAVGDFNGDGLADVAVANYATNNVSVLLGKGDGTFQAAVNYATGVNPSCVAVGDFNGDGHTDLVVTNETTNTVSVLLGNGDGTFQSALNYSVGAFPLWVAVADFNQDGKVDLAIASANTGKVNVLLGNGDGTFNMSASVGVAGNPLAVAIGDFNGDGRPDLAVINTSNSLAIYLGNGDGTFSGGSSFGFGSTPTSVVTADFNGDGTTDIAVGFAGMISIFSGNGNGSFLPQMTYTAGISASALVVGDFNGDGKPDLAATSQSGSTVSVLLGNGDFSFQSPVSYVAGTTPQSLAVADFNGDGKTDIAVASSPNNVGVLLGATLTATTIALAPSSNPSVYGQALTLTATVTPSAASGSVTFYDGTTALGSGTLASGQATLIASQLAAGSHSLRAYYNGDSSDAPGFSPAVAEGIQVAPTATNLAVSPNPSAYGHAVTLTATVTPSASGMAAFYDGTTLLGAEPLANGQAVLSTEFLAPGTRSLRAVYSGSANYAPSSSNAVAQTVTPVAANGFQPAVPTNTTPGLQQLCFVMGDFNGDGKPDIAVCGNSNVEILLGNGNGTFQAPVSYPVGGIINSIAVGDFNGDGKNDLVVTNLSLSVINLLFGNGDGTFQSPVSYNVGSAPSTVVVADFNGDGKADLALTNHLSQNVSVLLGNGDGTFQSPINFGLTNPQAMAVGDFNGDGKPDLAVGTTLGTYILQGNGDGTFKAVATLSFQGSTVGVADFNGDGKADLVLNDTSGINVLLGNGDGTFRAASNVANFTSSSFVAADINGDGKIDIAVIASTSSDIAVLLGNGDGTFQGPVFYQTGNVTMAIAAGDINGDGRADLVAGYTTGGISVLLGATYQPATVSLSSSPTTSTYGHNATLTATVSPSAAAGRVTFYDGTTVLGIGTVVNGQATLTTSLLLSGVRSLKAYYGGNATYGPATSAKVVQTVNALPASAFQAPLTFPGAGASAVAVGDFNGDGKADLAIVVSGRPLSTSPATTGGVKILLGNGDGTFQVPSSFSNPGTYSFYSVAVGDFNGDGKTDVAVTSDAGMIVLLGNGDGTLQNPVNVLATNPGYIVAGDFNADGKVDLVNAGGFVFLGNGDGTFQTGGFGSAVTGSGSPTLTAAIAVGDFNGDGIADLAQLIPGSGNMNVSLGIGDSGFRLPVSYPVGSSPNSVVAGDFNGDGITDLAVTSQSGVTVLLGNGDGTFKIAANSIAGSSAIAVGDFNGDGKADLAVTTNSGANVVLGNGDGTFQAPLSYGPSGLPFLAVGDFNGDGRTDLIFGSSVLLGANPTKLGFTTQPVNTAVGTALPAVVVQVQDANGVLDTGSSAAVAMTSTPAGVQSTTNAVNGVATFTGLAFKSTGTYTLTASSTGLTSATSNLFNIVSPYAISGQVIFNGVGLSGVTVTVSGSQSGSATTNATGNYNLSGLTAGGTFTLTPTFAGYIFTPASQTFPGLAGNQTANFTASLAPVTISGQVTVSGVAMSGVTIDVNGSLTTSVTTNATGNYSISVTQGGPYTLSAAALGFSFSSPTTFVNVNTNQTANFTGIAVAGLDFYPVTPCRLVDTRVSSFQSGFGPPSMKAGSTRTFGIPSNTACGIPANAAAYSLNVTAVTKGYLGILSIWPAGQPMPNVSTLNSYSNVSTAIANAAIVPAGTNGAINVYATDATDLVLDIDGYFAPPSTNGLVFYPVTPCRLVDTRVSTFPSGFGPPTMTAGSTRTFTIPSDGACTIPPTAQAYSLNVTAVPQSTLGFLSIWPTGKALPNVSTLNVYTPGTVVANAAIVPAGTNGGINAYVTDATDLVLDVNGYFAPPATGGLKLYPATPCRVADTRVSSFPSNLGPPSMGAGTQRSFLVPQSTCGIPGGAGAYSFNFTAVPHAPQLGIFITWPTGVAQPNVSTMNSYNGSVVANAAIVPAGTGGAISIYVTDLSDVLFDVNGYFAP